MGTRRPLAGWGGTGRPSLATRPTSALNHALWTPKCARASPWLEPFCCPAHGGLTSVLRVWPQHEMVCGRADPANMVLSGQRAACWPPGSQKAVAVGAWQEGTCTSPEAEASTSLPHSRSTEMFTAACEGKPGAQGHLGQSRPRGRAGSPRPPAAVPG